MKRPTILLNTVWPSSDHKPFILEVATDNELLSALNEENLK